jgi:xanthine dehydrogenase YagS FAD-binding subunit
MNPFQFVRASDVTSAVDAMTRQGVPGRWLAGGTNLVDLMRSGIEHPATLVDITHLPLADVTELPQGGLRIGALVRNSHLAEHPAVRERFPLLSHAILNGASAQLRNMATTGGNLMQRTRCYYFYDSTTRCNKREPGSGCDAIDGFNRIHAILGASPSCIATHPSDMCVALAALDAVVNLRGPAGERTLPIDEFHRLPGTEPAIDTNIQPDELILSVDLPASSSGLRSAYRKVRDRASYAFALISVAAAVRLERGQLRDVRIALGGVAHKPWRARTAERLLAGTTPTPQSLIAAADAELASARAQRHNAFKIPLARRTIASVLAELADLQGDAV